MANKESFFDLSDDELFEFMRKGRQNALTPAEQLELVQVVLSLRERSQAQLKAKLLDGYETDPASRFEVYLDERGEAIVRLKTPGELARGNKPVPPQM